MCKSRDGKTIARAYVYACLCACAWKKNREVVSGRKWKENAREKFIMSREINLKKTKVLCNIYSDIIYYTGMII